jgi:hypothetical protein
VRDPSKLNSQYNRHPIGGAGVRIQDTHTDFRTEN